MEPHRCRGEMNFFDRKLYGFFPTLTTNQFSDTKGVSFNWVWSWSVQLHRLKSWVPQTLTSVTSPGCLGHLCLTWLSVWQFSWSPPTQLSSVFLYDSLNSENPWLTLSGVYYKGHNSGKAKWKRITGQGKEGKGLSYFLPGTTSWLLHQPRSSLNPLFRGFDACFIK